MNPLRILTIASWAWPDAEGGSFRIATEVAMRLVGRGHSIHLLTARTDPSLPENEMLNGLRVHRYSIARRRGLSLYLSFRHSVREAIHRLSAAERFNVAHVHHLFSAHGALGALRDTPILYTCHMPYFLEHLDNAVWQRGSAGRTRRLSAAVLRRMDGQILRSANRVVVLSQFVLGLLQQYYPQCVLKAAVVPGAVDTERFRPGDRLQARRCFRLPPDAPIVLTVRRLEPRMGLENLLDAWATVRRAHPQARLVIAGRGSLREQLRTHADRLGLGSAVVWAGFVAEEDLPALYTAADLFVLPSRALEGFGLATLEALACGLPVLGTDVGATGEIIRPLEDDLMIPSPQPDTIATGILRFFARRDQPALSERCRRYVVERYAWPDKINTYEHLLSEIAAKEKPH